jgi:hypothetical protein
MALIPGVIPVTGFIGPIDSTDTYAVTDALYGIDGWRNVEDATERDAITAERRRKGMVVGTKDDGNYWKLLTDGPWNFDSTDWELFITGAGPITSGLWENIGGNIVTSSTMFSPGPPHVLPYFDDQQDLGSKLNRWRDLYLGSVIDFDTNLDFVVGGGSPDDSVLTVDNVGLSVYSGKVIRGQASTNYIDLDIAGAFGIFGDKVLILSSVTIPTPAGTNYVKIGDAHTLTGITSIGSGSGSGTTFAQDLTFDQATGTKFTDTVNSRGIEYAANYSANYTNRTLVDKEYADAVFVNNHKYVHSGSFTGGTVVTITHGLNTTDVICDVINTATSTKVWGAKVDNYHTNSIDVTISVTGTYKVVIVG